MNAKQDHLRAIKAAIYEMGLRFNQMPSTERINAYAQDLQHFSPEQIIFAFNQSIHSGSDYFPSLAKLLSYLKPREISPDDLGNLIADEVVEKALEFGIYRTAEAFEALSERSKKALGSARLIREICNSTMDQLPTIKAQIRGLGKASQGDESAKAYNSRLELLAKPGGHSNQLGMKPLELEGVLK